MYFGRLKPTTYKKFLILDNAENVVIISHTATGGPKVSVQTLILKWENQ